MDARTEAWMDQHDAWITDTIRKFGVYIAYVGGGTCSMPGCDGSDDGPPFAYTVGLFGLGHPELLIFGVSASDASSVLNGLADRVKAGENFLTGQLITLDDWPHKVVPEEVPNPGEVVFEANRLYARPPEVSVPVLQLSYPDEAGRYPWDAGFSAPGSQPRPGSFAA